MTKKKLRSIIVKSLREGPVLLYDERNNPYLGYVVFVREGLKYAVCTVDKDIADLNGPSIEFMIAESAAYLEAAGLEPS